MRFSRLCIITVALCATSVVTTMLSVPDPAWARTSFRSQLQGGTGAMRAYQDGRWGNIAVATANSWQRLSFLDTMADVLKVAERSHVIGWQEGQKQSAADAYASLAAQGWETVHDYDEAGRSELAVSWRSDTFSYVSHDMVKMHDANPYDWGAHNRSYPARYVLKVVLTHEASGLPMTVLNTHVNQHTERWRDRRRGEGLPYSNVNARDAQTHLATMAEMIAHDDSRWLVVTGDYNWGYVGDRRRRHPGFIEGRVNPVAVSSFKSLGLRNTAATHPPTNRYIDYVFLSRNAQAGFLGHETLSDMKSDHRPVIARIALD